MSNTRINTGLLVILLAVVSVKTITNFMYQGSPSASIHDRVETATDHHEISIIQNKLDVLVDTVAQQNKYSRSLEKIIQEHADLEKRQGELNATTYSESPKPEYNVAKNAQRMSI